MLRTVAGALLCILITTPVIANTLQSVKLTQNNALGPRSCTRTADKTLHLVYWVKTGDASKLYYCHSLDNGETWTPPFLLSQSYDSSSHACLSTDESGKLHVFWADAGKILYSTTPDNGRTWSPIYKVNGRYDHADMPSAVISRDGNIHITFESNGEIYYRAYLAKENGWSAVYSVSDTPALSRTPQLSLYGTHIGILWNEDGEIAYKELSADTNTWSAVSIISREAETMYGLKGKTNMNPQLAIDKKERVHALWGNGNKLIHRIKVNEVWSPAPSLVASDAMQWFGAPVISLDAANSLYCAWIEKGHITYRKYNGERSSWEMPELIPMALQDGFQASPAMGPAWSSTDLVPRQGFDLIYTWRASLEDTGYSLKAFSNTSFTAPEQAPVITGLTQAGGRFAVNWQPTAEQSSFRMIIGNSAPISIPYLYDSGIVDETTPFHMSRAFPVKDSELYVQVRTADRNGVWSEWSKPYLYKNAPQQSANGPVITLKAIEENSLYLYSPSPNIIFFGPGLDTPKTFTIIGTVTGKSSGIKSITFSKFGTNSPPPILEPQTADFEVQYAVRSMDQTGEVIITATDMNNNISETRVQVIKDIDPPQPPSWVRLSPDKEAHDTFKGKKSQKNKIYVYWTEGTDTGAGLRYHVMGTSPQWWKDTVHRSGDFEVGNEGENTFYVFAVDNVGNVSVPGTDMVFIDTIAPYPPKLLATVTSTNILQGIKSPDTTEVLVDGQSARVEITSTTNWRYTTTLQDNMTQVISLQARDDIGNASDIVTISIKRKTSAPVIYTMTHEPANTVLRGRDTLVIKLKGEPFNFAKADIPPIAYDIPLYDDGVSGDNKKNDGEYMARFSVPASAGNRECQLIGTLSDQAGNSAQKIDAKKVRFNPSSTVVLDDFEIPGDVYPWMNHVKARNIDATEEKNLQLPGSSGVCRIEYDMNGVQNWAGFSSREFIAKNCSGPTPKLQFKLKGTGQKEARAAVRLRTRTSDWSREIKELPSSEYTFSLGSTEWQDILIPIPDDTAMDLDQVLQYSIIIYTPDSKAKGTFYIDDLRLTYQPLQLQYDTGARPERDMRVPVVPQIPARTAIPEAQEQRTYAPQPDVDVQEDSTELSNETKGTFVNAPYFSVIIQPNPVRAGSPVHLKVNVPSKYKAQEAAILLVKQGDKLISAKLKRGAQDWWSATAPMPAFIRPGNYFGTLFVKTATGHFLKTKFPFQVIAQESNSPIDQAVVTFYPHPLIPGIGGTVKANIPRGLQAKKVLLFFGESSGAAASSELSIRDIGSTTEHWTGTITLPADLMPGDYNALLYIKDRTGKLYKKQIKYNVLKG